MGDDDRREGPSLELPSWRPGRRQRRERREPRRPSRREQQRATVPAPPPRPDPAPDLAPEPQPEPQPVARRTARRRPRLGGMPAAALTGLLVGLVTVGLTWGSQRGCEAVRGTSSCGDGPGFLLLLAIMVAMVFLGAGLLRLLGVPDPGSTSFLGVGLLAVITLLFLVGVIFAWWMAIVLPACAALTYALSHWVTTTYAEPGR